MNLFSGSAMVILLRSRNHPRITFCSDRPVSTTNFALMSMSSQGSVSNGKTSCKKTVSPSSGACSRRVVLSDPLRLTVSLIKLSI